MGDIANQYFKIQKYIPRSLEKNRLRLRYFKSSINLWLGNYNIQQSRNYDL